MFVRARKVRASADQGPKLGQGNIGQRPYVENAYDCCLVMKQGCAGAGLLDLCFAKTVLVIRPCLRPLLAPGLTGVQSIQECTNAWAVLPLAARSLPRLVALAVQRAGESTRGDALEWQPLVLFCVLVRLVSRVLWQPVRFRDQVGSGGGCESAPQRLPGSQAWQGHV